MKGKHYLWHIPLQWTLNKTFTVSKCENPERTMSEMSKHNRTSYGLCNEDKERPAKMVCSTNGHCTCPTQVVNVKSMSYNHVPTTKHTRCSCCWMHLLMYIRNKIYANTKFVHSSIYLFCFWEEKRIVLCLHIYMSVHKWLKLKRTSSWLNKFPYPTF